MKTNKILAFALGALMAVSCADFEEMNHNPKAVNAADAKPYWALNKAIIADQQNPNDAERVFVLYWADIARQDGESGAGGRCVGRSNDEWAGCLYNLTKNCVTSATTAINLVDEQLPNLTGHEAEFFPNVKAAAQIWRVYLMTEFVDSFGSFTTDFAATTPVYQSVEDCYKYMFGQLKEAVGAINVGVKPEGSTEENGDPAYKFDPVKWKNFGISMWMRLAMRLSEVDATTAKAEFAAAAAAGDGIITTDGTFRIEESTGWDDLSGVMSRTWDWQEVSATFANLTTNFGGAEAKDILKDNDKRYYPATPDVEKVYGPYIKDANAYLGVKMVGKKFVKENPAKDGTETEVVNLYEEYTDNPTQGFFFDGIPSKIDPRALAYFCLPGDYDNRIETGYANFPSAKKFKDGKIVVPLSNSNYTKGEGDAAEIIFADDYMIDATFAWNGLPCGFGYDDKASYNGLFNGDPKYNGSAYGITYAPLQERYRNGHEYRVFFGPWETHFLKAEAIVRGYIAGDAKAEYEAGIKASFDYLGLGSYAAAYMSGKNYNRVGTSVAWDHTDEPADFEIDYFNPVTRKTEKTTYKYPVASKTLYGKALNDQIAKIITQKYIANTPWLPLETWSDHRRTGLPFWEIPVSSTEYAFLDGWTKDSYKSGQKATYYPGRMNYPAKFNNASPEQYQNALSLMGLSGGEKTCAPLWWAKK